MHEKTMFLALLSIADLLEICFFAKFCIFSIREIFFLAKMTQVNKLIAD
jgi:hypothetical protein